MAKTRTEHRKGNPIPSLPLAQWLPALADCVITTTEHSMPDMLSRNLGMQMQAHHELHLDASGRDGVTVHLSALKKAAVYFQSS